MSRRPVQVLAEAAALLAAAVSAAAGQEGQLLADPDHARYEVVLTDGAGRPIEDAEVFLTGGAAASPFLDDGRQVRHAGEGVYGVDAAPGLVRAEVVHGGLRTTVTLRAARTGVVARAEVALAPAFSVPVALPEGAVTGFVWARAREGRPPSGAALPPEPPDAVEVELAPGAPAPARLVGLRAGRYDVAAVAEAADGSLRWAVATVTLPPPDGGLDLAFEPAAAVVGQVRGPGRAALTAETVRVHPLDRRLVRLRDTIDYGYGRAWEDARATDREGRFAFRGLPPGSWRVVAVPDDPELARGEGGVLALPGETGLVRLAAPQARAVDVVAEEDLFDRTVTALGPPGCYVALVEGRTVRVGGLRVGDAVDVTVRGEEDEGALARCRTRVPAEGEPVLAFRPTTRVRGRVFGPRGGEPEAGLRVDLVPLDPSAAPAPTPTHEARLLYPEVGDADRAEPRLAVPTDRLTDAEGAFELEAGAGRWRLEVAGHPPRDYLLLPGQELQVRLEIAAPD